MILTGLYALFKAGRFVEKLTLRLESIERTFSRFVTDFEKFQKADQRVHSALDARLDDISKKLEELS